MSDALDQVEATFRQELEKITVKTGEVLSCPGTTLDLTVEGRVRVTQEGCTRDILLSTEATKKATSSPATVDLRGTDLVSPDLSVEDSVEFHSTVHKLLHLARRTRPDILAVQLLGTRLTCATKEDVTGRDRVLHHLSDMSRLGPLLGAGSPAEVVACTDTSCGVHSDRRGRTGSATSTGSGTVHAGSRSQSTNTRSSCEC